MGNTSSEVMGGQKKPVPTHVPVLSGAPRNELERLEQILAIQRNYLADRAAERAAKES